MKRLRHWFYKQALKDPGIQKEIIDGVRDECIAYHNWASLLYKTEFPKNDNGSFMNCWQLYDYYFEKSGKREPYLQHTLNYDKK